MIKMELNDCDYESIKEGQIFEFKRVITTEDVKSFADLTEDHNPLHCDEKYASTTQFKATIVHGMLAASLFSTLLGMVCPGKRNLYLSQSLNFEKPIKHNSEIIVRGTVKRKIDSIKVLIIQTQIIFKDSIAVSGEAKVKVMEN